LTTPEPAYRAPLKRWQWAELWAFVLVIAVQLWLYHVSVVTAAAWGLLVPALLIHIYIWMRPLLRTQLRDEHRDEQG
jgi:hypothetical protein